VNPPPMIRNRTTTPVLEIDGLAKSYRRGFWGRRAAPAVADVSVSVERGEIFALLGHNGAGKTTTLKAVLGLVRPDRGRITIGGVDARQRAARAKVGYLPESPYFHENLTARELLDFYGRLLGLADRRRRERTAACLELVGLADDRHRRLADCSKGMRQRIGLAQALLGEPDLLILDEPQSGLDPLGRRLVRDLLLEQKRRGVTIVFSSHIVPDVEAIADRVAVIARGRLVEIKDLRRRRPAPAYRAVVDARAAARLVAPADAGLTVVARDEDRWTVAAAHAGALGALLVACHAAGAPVIDVQVQGGDLEAEFLADLAAEAPAPEVAPC